MSIVHFDTVFKNSIVFRDVQFWKLLFKYVHRSLYGSLMLETDTQKYFCRGVLERNRAPDKTNQIAYENVFRQAELYYMTSQYQRAITEYELAQKKEALPNVQPIYKHRIAFDVAKCKFNVGLELDAYQMVCEIRDICQNLEGFTEFEALCYQQVSRIANHHFEASKLLYEAAVYECAKQSCDIAYVAYYLLGEEKYCEEMKLLSLQLVDCL